MVGTANYMPPEQASGDVARISPSSDVYSLGATMYCLLTGRPPFQSASVMDTLVQVLGEDPLEPRRLNPAIPRDLETIVLKCLEKPPERRYASAGDLAAELQRWLRDEPIQARPIGPLARAWRWSQRHRAVAALLAALAVTLVIGTAISTYFAIATNRTARQFREALANLSFESGVRDYRDGRTNKGLVNLQLAWSLIGEHHPARLSFERVLVDRCLQGGHQLAPPLRHGRRIESVDFSPDGSSVLTASLDGNVRLWDAFGHSLMPPITIRAPVHSARFSPDGKQFATASADGNVQLWDPGTGRAVGQPLTHSSEVLKTCFSPDGRRLATICADNTARLWDLSRELQIGQPMSHGEIIGVPISVSVAFSDDGAKLLTSIHGKSAHIWDGHTAEPLGQPLPHDGLIMAAEFNPDASRVATCGQDGAVRLWNAESCVLIGEPLRQESGVFDVRFAPDGTRFAVGGETNIAQLFDAATLQPIGAPMPHQGGVMRIAFSPDGKRLATACSASTVHFWNGETGAPIGDPMAGMKGSSFKLSSALDGTRLVSGHGTPQLGSGTLRIDFTAAARRSSCRDQCRRRHPRRKARRDGRGGSPRANLGSGHGSSELRCDMTGPGGSSSTWPAIGWPPAARTAAARC
ncbi:MAG: protein kinase [Planctomycetaceae bacterium]